MGVQPGPAVPRKAPQLPAFVVVIVLALAAVAVLWVLLVAEPKPPVEPAPEGPQHWLTAIDASGQTKWRIGIRTEFLGESFAVKRLFLSPAGSLIGYIAEETVGGAAQGWMGMFNAAGKPIWKRSKTIHDCLFPDEETVAIVDSAPGEVYQLHLYDIKSPQLWWVPIEVPDGTPFHLELLANKSIAVVHGAADAAPGSAERGLILLASAHGDILFDMTPAQFAARPVRACAFRTDGSFSVEGRDGEVVSYDALGNEEWRTDVLEPDALAVGSEGEVYCVAEVPASGAVGEVQTSRLTVIHRNGAIISTSGSDYLDPATVVALNDGGLVAAVNQFGDSTAGWRIARFDAAGKGVWETGPTTGILGPIAIYADGIGRLQVTGAEDYLVFDGAGAVIDMPQAGPASIWAPAGDVHYSWNKQPGEVQAWDTSGRQLWAFSEPPSQLSCAPHAAGNGVLYLVTTTTPGPAS